MQTAAFFCDNACAKGGRGLHTWSSAANWTCKKKDMTEDNKCEKLQNSLVVPVIESGAECTGCRFNIKGYVFTSKGI